MGRGRHWRRWSTTVSGPPVACPGVGRDGLAYGDGRRGGMLTLHGGGSFSTCSPRSATVRPCPIPLPSAPPPRTNEIADALSFALRYQGRKRVHHADDMMARITAERLAPGGVGVRADEGTAARGADNGTDAAQPGRIKETRPPERSGELKIQGGGAGSGRRRGTERRRPTWP
jgi:hypothetical protein